MNNADYWARRFKQMEDALEDQSYEYVKNLEKQFDAAIRELEAQMRVWYQRFAENNSITYAEAQKILKSEELAEFKWTVQEYIKKGKENAISGEWMKELENASARVHISRLDSLKYQLRQQAEVLAQAKIKATADAAGLAYTESYYHSAFEIQRGFGVGWSMQGISENALKKVLARPWAADGQDFTARCWKDKARLVQTVNQELTRMIATGAAPDKAIATIAKQFKTSKNNAGRVVMTESAVFAGMAQKDCFDELGVEEFKVIETLDVSTCEVCGEMDGKIFSMREHAVGATAPPFHPWCRGCTAPHFADMEGIGERYARDVETGERYTMPKGITYKQWKEKRDAEYGVGTIDKHRKIRYNINTDKEQYKRYKDLIGDKDFPPSFTAFQKVKYNDPDLWEGYKALVRSRNYLQQRLDYVWYGEKSFIPQYTKFDKIMTIAGYGVEEPIHCLERLMDEHGGFPDDWRKRAGKVESSKYVFDLHWYERDGIQYEVKLKYRKEKD